MAVKKDPWRVRVLISYSRESEEHEQAVLALAQTLRRSGIDAWIDQFEVTPPRSWSAWMREQVNGRLRPRSGQCRLQAPRRGDHPS